MPSIRGQSILIIGGSSGIGAAVAKLALAEGVRVSIASSNESRVSKTVKSLESSYPGASIKGYTFALCRPALESGIEKLLSDVTTSSGSDGISKDSHLLDHIIFTAATVLNKPLAEIDDKYVADMAHAGIASLAFLAKLSPRFVKKSVTSSLIVTGGRVDEKPVPDYLVSSFVAAGLHGFVRALALDRAPDLRVNLVSPGATDTELWDQGGNRAGMRQYVESSALLKKAGSPEEVAEAYIYLMKDSNATGICVRSSGGVLLQ